MGGIVEQKKTDVLVREAISLTSFLVSLYIMRVLMKPDFARNFKMRGALLVKHAAQKQADSWQTVANTAATSYNKCRL
jgi:hypothetical protein